MTDAQLERGNKIKRLIHDLSVIREHQDNTEMVIKFIVSTPGPQGIYKTIDLDQPYILELKEYALELLEELQEEYEAL